MKKRTTELLNTLVNIIDYYCHFKFKKIYIYMNVGSKTYTLCDVILNLCSCNTYNKDTKRKRKQGPKWLKAIKY